jgi:outer membrane lipoprotein carrier protein
MRILVMKSLLLAMIVLVAPAYAQSSASQQLNDFVEHTQSFSANFTQTVTAANGQQMEQASGRFVLSRPGKFRWDYLAPYPQQIVADGQRIWFYDEDLLQVTVKSQQQTLAESPASLLSGSALPEDNYQITDLPQKDGLSWVSLQPKNLDSNYQSVLVGFGQNGLRQMIMQDSFQQQTTLVFTDAVVNQPVKDQLFQFQVPEGVDVVGDTGQ